MVRVGYTHLTIPIWLGVQKPVVLYTLLRYDHLRSMMRTTPERLTQSRRLCPSLCPRSTGFCKRDVRMARLYLLSCIISSRHSRGLDFVTGPVDSMKLLWRNYALSARGYGISARNILATKFRPKIYQDSSAIDRSEA